METSNPAAVRKRILDEHATLRDQLDALVTQPTVGEVARFFDHLEAHLDFEEQLLRPLLPADHATLLVREHAAQRRELRYMRSALHEPVGAELRPWLRHFATRLQRDMDAEERGRLSEEVLRD
jgi:hypothetical protein